MNGPDRLDWVAAEAAVPEQVVPYVRAVGGGRPRMYGPCVGFESAGQLVLVGYPLQDPRDEAGLEEAVGQALALRGLRRITVIGPRRPSRSPGDAAGEADSYYALPLPAPAPGPKLRNLLARAAREVRIERERRCGDEHMALVQRYIAERPLAAGTRFIFRQLPRYLEASADALLLSARRPDGSLAAFAVGEYASLHTAFFMFSFRAPELAPPGAADLLLKGLLDEAQERGQRRMNLGLGVNAGIRFFKGKWGAAPFLPCVETSWEPGGTGVGDRLRALFGRR